jgi:hypothetical protein
MLVMLVVHASSYALQGAYTPPKQGRNARRHTYKMSEAAQGVTNARGIFKSRVQRTLP